MSNAEPVIGVVIGTDFIGGRTFGGSSGFILSLIDKLGLPTRIFGIAYGETKLWHRYPINQMTSFIAVTRLSYPSLIPLRMKCLFSFLLQRRLILKSGIDILYIHSPEIALPFLFGNDRVPVIYHQHGSGNPLKSSKYSWGRSIIYQKIYDQIIRTVHRRSDWTIAIDRLSLAQAGHHGSAHKTSLIMNAIDTGKFFPDEQIRNNFREKMGIKDKSPTILFVGRLEEVKRVDRVLASLKYLNADKKIGRYRLFIAGDGTQREDLERFVMSHELTEDVIFLGYVPHQDLAGYYNMADVLVLPSEMEGVPMVILEALACGTPVVASRVGGIPDIVKAGINGTTLVKVDATSLAAAIRQVYEKQYSRQDLAATVAELSSVQFTEALLNIITKIKA